jgi:hypothetical protein
VPLLVLLLAVIGGGGYVVLERFGPNLHLSSSADPPAGGYEVRTSTMRFVMPEEPEVDPLPADELGATTSGTAWRVDRSDWTVQVMHIEFRAGLTDAQARGSFDGVVGGMARDVDGEITVNDDRTAGGLPWRHAIIRGDDASIFADLYASGSSVAVLIAIVDDADPPAAYDSLVDSFRFV